MFLLKDYQEWSLDALRAYFQECSRIDDVNIAFYTTTEKTIGTNIKYHKVDALPGLPYVCLRIPTGGGKTLIACHSIGIASTELSHTENPVVLWLVPSNAILDQTMDALQKPNHPYRQAIEETVGPVEILDIESALRVKKSQLDSNVNIIITTMQSFRVEEEIGRRVYSNTDELMDHFTGLPPHISKKLDRNESGNNIHCS